MLAIQGDSEIVYVLFKDRQFWKLSVFLFLFAEIKPSLTGQLRIFLIEHILCHNE